MLSGIMHFDKLDAETKDKLNKVFEQAWAQNDAVIAPERARREPFHQLVTPWSIPLLLDPSFRARVNPNRRPPPPWYSWALGTHYTESLWTDTTIPATFPFYLADPENKTYPWTYMYLAKVGTGMDAMTGRAHGALTAGLCDHVMGMLASEAHGANATVKMEVDYKKPVRTPCVLILRTKVTKIEGSRCWLETVLDDGEGLIFATATSLCVVPKGSKESGDPRGSAWAQGAGAKAAKI